MGAAQGDAALVHLGRPVRPARLMVVEHGGGGGGGGQYQLAISDKVAQRILNWDFSSFSVLMDCIGCTVCRYVCR